MKFWKHRRKFTSQNLDYELVVHIYHSDVIVIEQCELCKICLYLHTCLYAKLQAYGNYVYIDLQLCMYYKNHVCGDHAGMHVTIIYSECIICIR